MVNKYVRCLEDRDLNPKTGETWKVGDVPPTWYSRVLAKIESDGYVVAEDGTVEKRPENDIEIDEGAD